MKTMINLTAISNKITGLTPTHLMIKGNVQTHNEIITGFPSIVRKFLTDKKSVSIPELQDFYLSYFPNLKFDVVQIQNRKANKQVAGSLRTILKPGNFDIESFKLNIFGNGKGFFKRLFSINSKDTIFINKDFIDTITHETTHLMQNLIKTPLSILMKSLKKHLTTNELNELIKKVDFVFNEEVYLNKHFDRFIPSEFRADLMESLGKITKRNKKFQRVILKYFIKRAEHEQQAYLIGAKEAGLFSPEKWQGNRPNKPDFLYYEYFEPKIQIMKEEYFRLAKQMSSKAKAINQ